MSLFENIIAEQDLLHRHDHGHYIVISNVDSSNIHFQITRKFYSIKVIVEGKRKGKKVSVYN